MKQKSAEPLFAAIEAGGTKFDLAIGTADGQVLRNRRIATRDPAGTIAEVIAQFETWFDQGLSCRALGIGSFGPLDLEPRSPTWGHITNTPKPGWAMTNLAPAVSAALNLPCAIDTDVNSAALFESRLGSAQDLDCVAYFTIGTGIGGGAVVQGQLLHGLVHPEMGHIYLKRHPRDQFTGHCPFHGDCAEGLASGPALAARWGRPGEELAPDHLAWEIEAWYIAQLAVNAQMMLSPQAIVLGGGVMEVAGMLDKIRRQAQVLAASYLAKPHSAQDWANLIRPPRVENPGLRGALLLAADLYAAL